MLGAICGDIIGSRFEFMPVKTKKIDIYHKNGTYTDDTILTVAIAAALLGGGDFKEKIVEYANPNLHRCFGQRFQRWIEGGTYEPYNSWGNGGAMRVSPIGWAFDSEEEVLKEAKKSAEVTHNHEEGVRGAQAVALAVFLARNGMSRRKIMKRLETQFGYNLHRSLRLTRRTYKFEVSAEKSVPEAIICFLQSKNYEDAIRNAISLGGDSDTQAAIAGSIAEAYYGTIPEKIINHCRAKLDPAYWDLMEQFYEKYVRK